MANTWKKVRINGGGGGAAVWGSITGTLSSQTDLQTALNTKLTKGTKTIFCIDNGDFATGQAAVNAASPGDTILFGAKSGGWGDLVIPAGKKLSLKGLQADRSIYVQVGAITYSPTTGTQILENELYLDSLYISSSTATVLTFGGTAPARIRINNCYIYASGASNSSVVFSNSNASSSAYLYDCALVQATTSGAVVTSTCGYVRAYGSTVESSAVLLALNAGFFESNNTSWSGARAGEIIQITDGGTFVCGKSLLVNTTTNGSGVLMSSATAVFANSNNTFSIATGTGYCVRGTGNHLYGAYLTSNSAALAYNVKIQNTITSIPYTLTFTSSP
jgi:hypothetical protein